MNISQLLRRTLVSLLTLSFTLSPIAVGAATLTNVQRPPVVQAAASKTSPSADRYYTNAYRNRVLRPYIAPSIPYGATAKCRDNTFSFSQTRRGTCSHHGGVSTWY